MFYHPDGTPSPHPTSQTEARRHRRARYDDREPCPVCAERGQPCSIKYTANGRCIHCARLGALLFYNTAIQSGHDAPPLTVPTADMATAVDLFPFPIGTYLPAPTNGQEATHQGSPVFVRSTPCSKAGHIGLRTTSGGDCWFCANPQGPDDGLTPRQRAVAQGDAWYTPDKPCRRCGTRAPRRVNNGQCQGCAPQDQAARASEQLIAEAPDIVISRVDARSADLKVFRTGKPCRHGHTGFRYVSTGACIDCARGVAVS